MKHATIIDIARKLRISPSTVSRALSDHPDIKLETKERIRRTAKAMLYSPNPIAKSLKISRTTTIGVIVPEIKHDFFSSAISGMEEVAYRSGYTIILCQSNESFEREQVNVETMIHHRVAGVIVSITQQTKRGNHFQDLLKRKIPLVFFDRVPGGVRASKVVIDDYQSAFDAVSYLIGRGYRKIAHFGGPRELDICVQRWNGYINAMKKHRLPVLKEFVRTGGLQEQNGYLSMDALIREHKIPHAIFAVNDPVAIGAFQRIGEAGLRIPRDIAILGFSNNRVTALVDPPLTTVDQPSFLMGSTAAEILIETIEKRVTGIKTVILPAKLIVRGST